ncbi:hypothetical protein [Algoriphagus formosus]|uniref:hypothetical protein n=1 Tax=Algoriphagus formosus TaxID=2007308 RepID=UPI003F7020F1
MKQKAQNNILWQRRFTLALALLLCFFVSSLEYVTHPEINKIEHQSTEDGSEQAVISMAVDAVVPFAVQLTQTALYFIYDIISFEPRSFTIESASFAPSNQLVEILFERIISTLGP